jgi:Sulfotransferase family
MSRRPVLITGAHRSGTTWVGATLSAGEGVAYLHEPFNVAHLRPGMCRARFPHSFMHINAENSSRYREDLARMLRWEFSWHDAVASVRSKRSCVASARTARAFRTARSRHSRPLLKDPIALFSAEWLAETFDMDVLVLIRHPAAFAASLARIGWRFDFRNFLSQPSLMDTDLAPFAGEIEHAVRHPLSIIDEAALLWRCIYATVYRYRDQHLEWMFLRHEDLSANPDSWFQAICNRTGIPFAGAVAEQLRRNTSADNPVDAPPGATHALMRNSTANISRWRQQLDPGEIAAIRASVEDVSSRFYSDGEWPA